MQRRLRDGRLHVGMRIGTSRTRHDAREEKGERERRKEGERREKEGGERREKEGYYEAVE